jgi:hypothetical protein
MRRQKPEEDDFDRAWRQTVRWLVADVPERVNVNLRPVESGVRIGVQVRDSSFLPLDNASIAIDVRLPDASTVTLAAEPAGREPGAYAATFVTRQPGAYRFTVRATAPDGSAVGTAEAGWAAQPAADEFARLEPDREYLERIAAETGGEVVESDDLDSFVASLATRDAPIVEPWSSPLWHHPLYFLVAIVCLVGEWGLRRVKGLR